MARMTEELAAFARIAMAAGKVILDLREGINTYQSKVDGSPVTAADVAAEDTVLDGLSRIEPDAVVVAEERVSQGQTLPAAVSRFYLVDALDGTREFINGRNEFTVNVARIENGEPTLGVVIAPALGEGFAADADGAFAFTTSGEAPGDLRTIAARPPGDALSVVVSRSHETPETETYLKRFTIGQRLSFGSSLKFCRVADGGADFYPRLGRTMEWDTAAGDAILRCAGGSVRTLDGQLLRYGKIDNPDDAPFANPHFLAFGAWPAAQLPFP